MKPLDTFSEAIWGLASRPGRTLATIVALAIAVATVALVASVLSGFERQIEQMSFGAYGRALVIRENYFVEDRHGPPRLSDIDRLREALPHIESVAAWRVIFGADVVAGRERQQLEIYGAQGDYQREASAPVFAGRALTPDETVSAQRLCLIGDGAAARLFPDGNALHESIRINGISCRVIGIFGEPENRVAERYSNAVITPFATAARYFSDETYLAPDEVTQITLLLTEARFLSRSRTTADRVMRRRYGAPLSQTSPFMYSDPAASVRSLRQQRGLVARLLIVVAGIALTSGLIGYGAAVAAAASERQREVALRRTLGATQGDIVIQFLTENAILGIFGGALGSVIALGVGALASTTWGWPVEFQPWVFSLSAGLGLLCGLVFGALPARRAAASPPAGAARA